MGKEKSKEAVTPEQGTSGTAPDTTGTTDTNSDAAKAPTNTITVSAEELDALIASRVEQAVKEAEANRPATTGKAISYTDHLSERQRALEAERAYLEEYVEVKLFKDNKDYKDDVFVAVNGENCAIKRGIRVKIKRKFALVIEQGELQDVATSEMCDAKSAEYADAAKAAGVN